MLEFLAKFLKKVLSVEHSIISVAFCLKYSFPQKSIQQNSKWLVDSHCESPWKCQKCLSKYNGKVPNFSTLCYRLVQPAHPIDVTICIAICCHVCLIIHVNYPHLLVAHYVTIAGFYLYPYSLMWWTSTLIWFNKSLTHLNIVFEVTQFIMQRNVFILTSILCICNVHIMLISNVAYTSMWLHKIT